MVSEANRPITSDASVGWLVGLPSLVCGIFKCPRTTRGITTRRRKMDQSPRPRKSIARLQDCWTTWLAAGFWTTHWFSGAVNLDERQWPKMLMDAIITRRPFPFGWRVVGCGAA